MIESLRTADYLGHLSFYSLLPGVVSRLRRAFLSGNDTLIIKDSGFVAQGKVGTLDDFKTQINKFIEYYYYTLKRYKEEGSAKDGKSS